MIRSQSEYEVAIRDYTEAKERLVQLRASLQEQGFDEVTSAELMDSELAFAAQLNDEIEAYERICKHQFEPVPLQGLGRLLIKLRIANGLSQRDLAERCRVDPSVVSRDERNEYRGITLDRAGRIIEALDERIDLTVTKRPIQAQPLTFSEFNALQSQLLATSGVPRHLVAEQMARVTASQRSSSVSSGVNPSVASNQERQVALTA